MTATQTTPEAGTTVHVAPGTLLLERNIRHAKPDADLIASVEAVGVLEPIVAVTTPAGLLVRFGQRRTLAALEAGSETVPVYVQGPDDSSNKAEVARIISQRDENTQRQGLTASDDIAAFEQLAAFGLSAEEITKQARVRREDVDRALAVTKSPLARKAAAKYSELTLDQAATVAEFEDDTELAKALIVTAMERPGQFAHAAQRARDDRAWKAAVREATAELTATGVTVIERPSSGSSRTQSLDMLLSNAGKNLTLKAHKTCAGHVAWLSGKTAVYGCTNPKAYGHKERYPSGSFGTGRSKVEDMSPAEREEAKQARQMVIENNKAWDSATTVRREWLAELAKRKTAPKGAAAFISRVIGVEPGVLGPMNAGKRLAEEWLGVNISGYGASGAADAAEKATEGRALLIALVQVLAGVESDLGRNDWRQNGKTSSPGRYLRYLNTIGYGLSEVETFAVSSKTA